MLIHFNELADMSYIYRSFIHTLLLPRQNHAINVVKVVFSVQNVLIYLAKFMQILLLLPVPDSLFFNGSGFDISLFENSSF